MRLRDVCLAAVWILGVCACSTLPPPGTKLSEAQVAELARRARTAKELGVETRSDTPAPRALANLRGTRPGLQATIDLNVRPFERAEVAIARVRINGTLVLAVIDTGSAITFLEYGAAIRCGVTPLRPLTTLRCAGFGGPSEQYLAVAQRLSIGDIDVCKVPLGILDSARGLDNLSWIAGYRVEMVLGSDCLSAFRWMTLNAERETLTLSTGGRFAPDPKRLVASLPLRSRNGVPAIEAAIDGRAPLPVLLDSGGQFGLWIPRALAATMNLPEFEHPAGVDMGAALGGPTVYKPAAPRTVVAGGLRLPAVSTVIGMTAMSSHEPTDALLGSLALKDFAVTLDYGAGTVYFETP